MKTHPLFEKHSEIFKIYSGYYYYLTKFFGDFLAFMFCVLSSILLALGIIFGALTLVAFFGPYSILGSIVFMIAIVSMIAIVFMIAIVKFSRHQEDKRNNTLTSISLDKRMSLAKDVIDSSEQFLSKNNLEKNKVTTPVIDNFKNDLHKNISYLVSDDPSLILKGFKYIYGNPVYDAGPDFYSDLKSLKSKALEKEQAFKEDLSNPEKNQKKDNGEKRLSVLLKETENARF